MDNLLADAAAAVGTNQQPAEALNRKALDIIQRVRDKLTGRDFDRDDMLDIAEQVGRDGAEGTKECQLCTIFYLTPKDYCFI